MSDPELVPIQGSGLGLPTGAEPEGVVADDEPVEVSFVLRAGGGERGSPAARFGPRLEDVHAVLGWAAASGFALEDVTPVARTITLSAPAGRWRERLGVKLVQCSWEGLKFRGHAEAVSVPAEIAPAMVGAFGLDARPVGTYGPVVPAAESATVSPMQLRSAYRLPPGIDGTGQAIGVISLGGRVDRSDLILGALKFGLPAPALTIVPTRSAPWAPEVSVAHPARADDQALALATQVPATLATGAQLVVYAAANTGQGLVDAIAAAIADRERRPSVLLMTWTSAEEEGMLSRALARSLASMFETAGALGITVVATTSLARMPGRRSRRRRTPYPSAAPHVLACADTDLVVGAHGVESQAPWTSAGASRSSAPSALFDAPEWQEGVAPQQRGKRQGRTVPDVCAHGAGYLVTVGGAALALAGGGSGAAVWAATVALLNQRLGRRLGVLAPVLYEAVANGNGTTGSWDPDCGLGPPDADALSRALADRT